MPRVSVIIPTYNRAVLVIRAVDSVLAQTYDDFELIVVDDGSTDDTGHRLANRLGDMTYKHQKHAGVSAARNAGLEMARGELIAFLDSDDYWLPDKLSVQVGFFDEHQEAMICQTEETWIRRGKRVNPMNKHAKPSGDVFRRSLELCLVSPSAVMIRRELFSRVGVFDEKLPACEDYDLWLRISARYPVHLIDRAMIVKTGGHEDQLSRTVVGLDQYRVASLLKLLESGMLNGEQIAAARNELVKKARIYGQGCFRRGRTLEARKYMDLAERHACDTE